MVGTIMPMARYLRSSWLVMSADAVSDGAASGAMGASPCVVVAATAGVVVALSAEAELVPDPECAEVPESNAP